MTNGIDVIDLPIAPIGGKTEKKPGLRTPRMYKVIILNDDYTPMDFVVFIMKAIFNKSHEEAVALTYRVHQKGLAVAGVYSHEIAETKVLEVQRTARANGHPLQATMEQE